MLGSDMGFLLMAVLLAASQLIAFWPDSDGPDDERPLRRSTWLGLVAIGLAWVIDGAGQAAGWW